MAAYYNEIDPVAAHLLRCLIKDGVIAPGDVDERSIKDVAPSDLKGYTQCHFFAGGGLWSVAARLASWPDDRPLWTGSCPCQSFSVAGKGLGTSDPRHLWPDFFRLIHSCRPPVVMGEQVAGKAGYGWFDGVATDLEGEGYACRAVDIPACSIDAPHIRQRLYWGAINMGHATRQPKGAFGGIQTRAEFKFEGGGHRNLANTSRDGRRLGAERDGETLGPEQQAPFRHDADGCRDVCFLADADGGGCGGRSEAPERGAEWRTAFERAGRSDMADADGAEPGCRQLGLQSINGGHRGDASEQERASFWIHAEWRIGADGKSRRVEPDLRLLVDGFPGRVGLLRIAGNAIVPQVAAEVIRAFMDVGGVDE